MSRGLRRSIRHRAGDTSLRTAEPQPPKIPSAEASPAESWDLPAESPAVAPPPPKLHDERRSTALTRHAEDVLAEIENMIDSGEFRWATFLQELPKSIEEAGQVTHGQIRALNKIRDCRGWDPIS